MSLRLLFFLAQLLVDVTHGQLSGGGGGRVFTGTASTFPAAAP